jgi:hypothetical protein
MTTCPPAAETELQIETVLPRSARGRCRATETRLANELVGTRLPRITRLMALAIKLQRMVETGDIRDYADIARVGYVSRARVTQIMNLVNLAPDIQEALLCADDAGSKCLTERDFRTISTFARWSDQRLAWRAHVLSASTAGSSRQQAGQAAFTDCSRRP